MSPQAGPTVAILMGVAGAGKTSVGTLLARALGVPFIDGDQCHAPESIQKMRAGVPLGDEDRKPWLAVLRRVARDTLRDGASAVIACSALKRSYRRYLSWGMPGVLFVYLRADAGLLRGRLRSRQGHFMRPEMLESQLAALEEPGDEALTLDASRPLEEIVSRVLEKLGPRPPRGANQAPPDPRGPAGAERRSPGSWDEPNGS